VLLPAAAPEEPRLIDFSHSYFEGHLPPFVTDKKEDPKGTALYSAPEKWDGNFTKGFKSDVFAFGVTAYYVCTGKHPFDGSLAQFERAIREEKAPFSSETWTQSASQHSRHHHGMPGKESRLPTDHGTSRVGVRRFRFLDQVDVHRLPGLAQFYSVRVVERLQHALCTPSGFAELQARSCALPLHS